MFGFLRAAQHDRMYRQVYAGCCGFQHARFGITTLPLLSYESIFLYVLAMDAGLCSRPHRADVTCCRFRRSGKRLHKVDSKLAEFCSAFGLLLASIKLEDDVRDDRSLLARLALWQLRNRIERAFEYFSILDASFRKRVARHIQRHLDLEHDALPMTIDEYAKPTAEAFSYVVGLYHHLVPERRISEKQLTELGTEIGRAIICFDCAVDWERDRRRGRFNPLPNKAAVEAAFLESQRSLSRIAWLCRDDFGSQSVSASVAGATFERVQRHVCPTLSKTSSIGISSETVRRPNVRRMRRGDCDCFCDPSCCEAGCAEAGCFCPCEVCFFRLPAPTTKHNTPAQQGDNVSRIGLVGHTDSPLNPTGVVEINGERLPAQSEGEWIDANTVVEVVREEAFGVVVRARRS